MKRLKKTLLAALALLCASASAKADITGGRDDFRDETIYFAMTTRFYDGDPTNNVCGWDHQNVQIANNDPDWRGDFKGLIDRLDYIKALGFTAIWITPIVQNSSGTDFHGYHAMDFSKVDLRYESRTQWGADQDVTFQSLIDAAHAKGMKIILDIVLNHTGNFGENRLAQLFTRSQNIRNQANIEACMIPNEEKLGSNYYSNDGKTQYNIRFPYLKNTDGTNKDSHNYWHHIATNWNWDLPNRWWGQIAGDCVDLNTENPAVAQYLVECYGKFIEMGVDGFRIDTTGHISRLTFNTSFIPQFMALGEKYKHKRLNGCPFYMFGECCARFSDPTYRDQPNLSSYFYTWKSPENLVSQWNTDASYWDNVYIKEGDDTLYGNMALCDAEPSVKQTSENVFMKNGAWHEPDYSQASGFNIIDFPMHYNFNNAGAAVEIARKGDQYYNDASYNVVYVDSHDYCPGPDDLTRFNGGTQQWAENLSLMFTFRGIPCIYYGTEVEFQKGKKVDAGGTDMPVKDSGRAYFGHYLTGEVTATDFGEYTASGNVETTLGADLAQHIIRLNQIRAAVPALRKGQYTWDGCSANGGYAFKRAYKDSYALVAINGGATFTNVPEGEYTDIVTGQKYQGGSSITVSAPATKGQLRVLVKDWQGGKVGTDGKFIYDSTPVDKGGNVTFTDPGTTQYYTADDAVPTPGVKFVPGAGSFRTETLDVEVSLNESAVSGWYAIDGGSQVSLTQGASSKFTIGEGLAYGTVVKINWGVTGNDGETYTGTVSYKKVDPNAAITVYIKSDVAPNLYAWDNNKKEFCGAWPGKALSDTKVVNGETFYYYTFDDTEYVNIIINSSKGQTSDILDITEDTFFDYQGTTATKLEGYSVEEYPVVTLSPRGGEFVGTVTVTATPHNATSATLAIGSGAEQTITSATTFTLGEDMTEGESVTVTWTATDGTETRSGEAVYTKVAKPSGMVIYYDNSVTRWNPVKIHYWGGEESSSWSGVVMNHVDGDIYSYTVPNGTKGIIFNNGSDQTNDITSVVHNHVYKGLGNRQYSDLGEYAGVEGVTADENLPAVYYNLQGIEIKNPTRGFYIVRRGNKAQRVFIR